MGYDQEPFLLPPPHELICAICNDVLQDPVQVPACEHVFCRSCLTTWLAKTPTCPSDNEGLNGAEPQPAPRIIRTLLENLTIRCGTRNCSAAVSVGELKKHEGSCQSAPASTASSSAARAGIEALRDGLHRLQEAEEEVRQNQDVLEDVNRQRQYLLQERKALHRERLRFHKKVQVSCRQLEKEKMAFFKQKKFSVVPRLRVVAPAL